MRVVVDTNVLVSGMIRPRGVIGRVVRGLRDRQFVSIVSRPMLEEVVDVLGRPRLREKYGVDEATLKDVLTRIAWKNHKNGALNPKAQFKKALTLERMGAHTTAHMVGRDRLDRHRVLNAQPASDLFGHGPEK